MCPSPKSTLADLHFSLESVDSTHHANQQFSLENVRDVPTFRHQLTEGSGVTLLHFLLKNHPFVDLGQLLFRRETQIKPSHLLHVLAGLRNLAAAPDHCAQRTLPPGPKSVISAPAMRSTFLDPSSCSFFPSTSPVLPGPGGRQAPRGERDDAGTKPIAIVTRSCRSMARRGRARSLLAALSATSMGQLLKTVRTKQHVLLVTLEWKILESSLLMCLHSLLATVSGIVALTEFILLSCPQHQPRWLVWRRRM